MLNPMVQSAGAAFRGNAISVKNYNGMSAFVMTTESSQTYYQCGFEHKTNYLPQLIDYFLEICPNLPAAAVWAPDDEVFVWSGDCGELNTCAFRTKIWGNVGALIAKHPE